MTQPPSYCDLLALQDRQLTHGEIKPQTAANRASVLRAFVKFKNLNIEDPVGHELRAAFNCELKAFVESLRAAGRAQRNITNTLSALRAWRRLIVALDTERAIAGDNLPPFNLAFRTLLKDQSVTALSRALGVPRDMMFGWLKGKRPRLSNARYINRVERYFGVEEGELAILAGISRGHRAPVTTGEPVVLAYRETLAKRSGMLYLFKPDADSPLRSQWRTFMKYKTALRPRLMRRKDATWRIAPVEFHRETAAKWYQFLDGREVPSARMAWNCVARYLGWLTLPAAEGGAGISADEGHTLAWLCVAEHVESYVQWELKRSGDKFHGGLFEFLTFLKAVLREGVGYLRQQREFLATLPARYQCNAWEKICAECFGLAQDLEIQNRDNREQARNPQDPIRHILELDNPMEPIADMVQRMRADRPLGGSPMREAIWARDMALIKLLISNPLRLRNLATLTWRADNTGDLYQRADGSWWVRIEKKRFKNARGAARDTVYDMPVQPMAWTDIERYVKVFRPRLLRDASDFVFLTMATGAKHRPANTPWNDLSGRVEALTRKYLWRCPGVGTHAFRHLVATSIIKASNLSDFKTAALVLNDRLSTVEKHYSHLHSADGANRMSELLGNTFARM